MSIGSESQFSSYSSFPSCAYHSWLLFMYTIKSGFQALPTLVSVSRTLSGLCYVVCFYSLKSNLILFILHNGYLVLLVSLPPLTWEKEAYLIPFSHTHLQNNPELFSFLYKKYSDFKQICQMSPSTMARITALLYLHSPFVLPRIHCRNLQLLKGCYMLKVAYALCQQTWSPVSLIFQSL